MNVCTTEMMVLDGISLVSVKSFAVVTHENTTTCTGSQDRTFSNEFSNNLNVWRLIRQDTTQLKKKDKYLTYYLT